MCERLIPHPSKQGHAGSSSHTVHMFNRVQVSLKPTRYCLFSSHTSQFSSSGCWGGNGRAAFFCLAIYEHLQVHFVHGHVADPRNPLGFIDSMKRPSKKSLLKVHMTLRNRNLSGSRVTISVSLVQVASWRGHLEGNGKVCE